LNLVSEDLGEAVVSNDVAGVVTTFVEPLLEYICVVVGVRFDSWGEGVEDTEDFLCWRQERGGDSCFKIAVVVL